MKARLWVELDSESESALSALVQAIPALVASGGNRISVLDVGATIDGAPDRPDRKFLKDGRVYSCTYPVCDCHGKCIGRMAIEPAAPVIPNVVVLSADRGVEHGTLMSDDSIVVEDDDPICVCGVYRSEHAAMGCAEGFQTPEQWESEKAFISTLDDDTYEAIYGGY